MFITSLDLERSFDHDLTLRLTTFAQAEMARTTLSTSNEACGLSFPSSSVPPKTPNDLWAHSKGTISRSCSQFFHPS